MAAIVCGALLVGPAFADELSEAQDALTQAEERLVTLTNDYEAIQEEIKANQVLIDETLEKVFEAQAAVIAGQDALSHSIAYSYKVDNVSMLTMLLESKSINELLANIRYLNCIQVSQAREISDQKERKEALDEALAELDAQRDDQEKRLQEAADKRTEAENIVASASAKVEKIQDDQAQEEARRLEELKRATQALEQQQQSQAPDLSDDWNTNTESESNPKPEPAPAPNPAPPVEQPEQPQDSSSGWQTGIASAYGGSTDPYTPNPGYTATGAICDDYSMGVAIPMSWPNYRSYLGRSVEISYGGKTVVAVVNDCGYMGGGSRSLDLQPGVFKAFGFSSCNDWGVRSVSYRFL